MEKLPYAEAKTGIINLAKGLSKAYGPDGVLVNAEAPDFIATPMTDAQMEKKAKAKGISFDEVVRQTLDAFAFLAVSQPWPLFLHGILAEAEAGMEHVRQLELLGHETSRPAVAAKRFNVTGPCKGIASGPQQRSPYREVS